MRRRDQVLESESENVDDTTWRMAVNHRQTDNCWTLFVQTTHECENLRKILWKSSSSPFFIKCKGFHMLTFQIHFDHRYIDSVWMDFALHKNWTKWLAVKNQQSVHFRQRRSQYFPNSTMWNAIALTKGVMSIHGTCKWRHVSSYYFHLLYIISILNRIWLIRHTGKRIQLYELNFN